jgi:hypothetical protein
MGDTSQKTIVKLDLDFLDIIREPHSRPLQTPYMFI